MTYASEVLADGPAMWYRMGEASGTTMIDSSGNGRNGTYTGMTLGTTGLLTGDSDTAATLAGSPASALIADDNVLDGLSVFTCEAWIKGSGSFSGTNYIANRDDGGSNRSFLFRISSNKLQFVKIPNGTVTMTSAASLAVGTLYYVAAVYNGTDIRLYINGVLDGTPAAATGTLGTIARDIDLGARLGTNFYTGVMDEVAFYTKALTATRIAAHYTAGTGGTVTPPPLSGTWGLVS